MKTSERILNTSLNLFNEEGEPNVTTVDIANEMEISPGNLYYHFRGKEVIVEALYDQFDKEMTDILSADFVKVVGIKDSWFYLYVVLEQMYNYRFFYFNLTDILRRYDRLQKRFKRLIKLKTTTTKSICTYLQEESILKKMEESEMIRLVDQIVMTLLYWFAFNELNDRLKRKPELLMHDGVFQIMTLLAPYLREEKVQFFNECKYLYFELIQRAEKSL